MGRQLSGWPSVASGFRLPQAENLKKVWKSTTTIAEYVPRKTASSRVPQ